MIVLIKALLPTDPEYMEEVRRKIVSDLNKDGVAIIPAGYELVKCEITEGYKLKKNDAGLLPETQIK